MREVHFVTPLHKRTKRDYAGRVTEADKSECALVAKKWGKDYWDGDRKYGYGGYSYDGRWSVVAEAMIKHYNLDHTSSILDVGCGKGYLLFEITKLLPGLRVQGIDVSSYAIDHSKPEIRDRLISGDATHLPFDDNEFDLVISITTLHNLKINDLKKALQEIQRVTRGDAYLMVESYRNEREKMNLLYWQLTCESFFDREEWLWLYNEFGYLGDYEFIYFE